MYKKIAHGQDSITSAFALDDIAAVLRREGYSFGNIPLMNYLHRILIQYNMRKKYVIKILLAILIFIVALIVPILYSLNIAKAEVSGDSVYINLWQIDGFEGGRGSRKVHIENTAKKLFKDEKVYCTVTSLTAKAARANIANGTVPEIISYPSGFHGIENYVNNQEFTSKVWCYGCYCLLTLETDSDFGDVNISNTIINSGKDNLAGVCAALVGLNGAVEAEPTNAYLQLLNGKYKYLLGTQRDIFRLETRKATYSVKPIDAFNDLFQNISILTYDTKKYEICKELIGALNKSNVSGLGLFGNEGSKVAEQLIGLNYGGAEYTLKGLSSKQYIDELKASAKNGDIKKLKSILR